MTHSPSLNPRRKPSAAQSSTNPGAANSAAGTNIGGSLPHSTGGAPYTGGGGPLYPGSSSDYTHSSSSNDNVRVTLDSRRWTALLNASGVRGKAVAALAQWLSPRRQLSVLSAAELATDVLTGEADTTLEAVITLLSDGWELSLGELLACARTV